MNVEFVQELLGHQDPIYQIIPFDDNHFLTASGDGVIAKWNIHTFDSTALAKCRTGVYAICIVNHDYLAIGTNQGILHILDFKQKEIIHSYQLSTKQIFAIHFIQSTQELYIGDGEGQLTVIHRPTWKLKDVQKLSKQNIRSISTNKNESLIAIGTSDDSIYVFSLPDLNQISILDESQNSVFCLQFISDTTLISGGRDAHLRTWDVVDQQQINAIPAHQFTINDLSFNHDNTHFATASRDKSFRVWQADTLDLKKVVNREKFPDYIQHSINTICWMGNKLLCGGDDRKVLIWNVDLS